jgi:hypothetical protein
VCILLVRKGNPKGKAMVSNCKLEAKKKTNLDDFANGVEKIGEPVINTPAKAMRHHRPTRQESFVQ